MLQALLLMPSFLATDPSPLEEKSPVSAPSVERPAEPGARALYSWGDYDGDGRQDVAAVTVEGGLRLLRNTGEGRFEDATALVGLGEVRSAALARWVDYDQDGRVDLFVGAREGTSLLFRNEGGAFIDMSAASGLVSEGSVSSADWLDHDGDGRLDLFLVTAERSALFRQLEGGFFEVSELALVGALEAPEIAASPVPLDDREVADGVKTPFAPASSSDNSSPRLIPSMGGGTRVNGVSVPGGSIAAVASPIVADRWVDEVGDMMTGTLTLAPTGDQALDVSTGSIYKGGALFIHTKGSSNNNTAIGREALMSVTTGGDNTASGLAALRSNTSGFYNTASGAHALVSNTTGYANTASGAEALVYNTTGSVNTATGVWTLLHNTTGSFKSFNTASGFSALNDNTTGIF